MMLKNSGSGIRHTRALLPALPCTGCVTLGGYLTSLGLRLPQVSSGITAASAARIVGRMNRSKREHHLVWRLADYKSLRIAS